MAARNWPLFNETAACPKCGCAEVGASWRRAGDAAYSDRLNVFDTQQGDWLQRFCQRCHFGWPEEPLDRCAADRKAAESA